jgi:hypothetical protein
VNGGFCGAARVAAASASIISVTRGLDSRGPAS